MSRKAARVAAALASGAAIAAAILAVTSSDSDNATPAAVPSAPAAVHLTRPVRMRWRTVTGAARYRVWVNGTVVRTTTLTAATVRVPCTGTRRSRLNVQAVGPTGALSAMKAPRWVTC